MADFTFTITVPDAKAAEILEVCTDSLKYNEYVEENGPITRQDFMRMQVKLWLRHLYQHATRKKLRAAAKATQIADADLVTFD